MSGSICKVIIVGNVGADPDIRRTQDGRAIANLRIATSETWRDKETGDRREKTEWHRIVIFGAVAEIAEKYVKKGSKLYVEGTLQTREWEDQQGVKRYATEVVLKPYNGTLQMLDGPKGRNDDGNPAPRENRESRSASRPAEPAPSEDDYNDDIPF
jgi:single-strand DNA-binding protein